MYNGYKGESYYRKTIISTINKTEYDSLKDICSKLEYSFSPYDLIRFANAYKVGDNSLKSKIEYILTDCNFHSECSMLMTNQADKLIDISKKEIDENLINEVKDVFVQEFLKNKDDFIPANSNLLDNFSIEELYFCVDKNIIKKINCEGLAFELSDKEKNKIFDPSRNFYAEFEDDSYGV